MSLSNALAVAISKLNTDIAASASVSVIAADQAAVNAAQLAVNASLCGSAITSVNVADVTVAYLMPTLNVSVSASSQTYTNIGQKITFTYAVNFPFALSSVNITDSILGSIGTFTGQTTANANSIIGTAVYSVVAADLVKKSLSVPTVAITAVTVATASIDAVSIAVTQIGGTSPTSTPPIQGTLSFPTVANNCINTLSFAVATVVKTAAGATISSGSYASVGNQIFYTLTTTNTGNTPITATITDAAAASLPLATGFTTVPFQVAVGASSTTTGVVTVTQPMIDRGQYANTFSISAIVTGTTVPVSVSVPASSATSTPNLGCITIVTLASQLAGLSITGTVSPTTFLMPSQSLQYSLTVSNPPPNNVTLTGIQIFLQGSTTPLLTTPTTVTPSSIVLAPGASTILIYTDKTASSDIGHTKELVFNAQGVNGSCVVSSNTFKIDVQSCDSNLSVSSVSNPIQISRQSTKTTPGVNGVPLISFNILSRTVRR